MRAALLSALCVCLVQGRSVGRGATKETSPETLAKARCQALCRRHFAEQTAAQCLRDRDSHCYQCQTACGGGQCRGRECPFALNPGCDVGCGLLHRLLSGEAPAQPQPSTAALLSSITLVCAQRSFGAQLSVRLLVSTVGDVPLPKAASVALVAEEEGGTVVQTASLTPSFSLRLPYEGRWRFALTPVGPDGPLGPALRTEALEVGLERVPTPPTQLRVYQRLVEGGLGTAEAYASWAPAPGTLPACRYALGWSFDGEHRSSVFEARDGLFAAPLGRLPFGVLLRLEIGALGSPSSSVPLPSSTATASLRLRTCLQLHKGDHGLCGLGPVRKPSVDVDEDDTVTVSWAPPDPAADLTVRGYLLRLLSGCDQPREWRLGAEETSHRLRIISPCAARLQIRALGAGNESGEMVELSLAGSQRLFTLDSRAEKVVLSSDFIWVLLALLAACLATGAVLAAFLVRKGGRPDEAALVQDPCNSFRREKSPSPKDCASLGYHSIARLSLDEFRTPRHQKRLSSEGYADADDALAAHRPSELGRGRYGRVIRLPGGGGHKAQAIKMSLMEGPAWAEAFRRETELTRAASAESAWVVGFLGEGHTHQGLPFIRLELCEDGDLLGFLREAAEAREAAARGSEGSECSAWEVRGLGPAALLERVGQLVRQTAEGMAAVGRAGILHRDLAARNLLLTDGCRQVRIADFGLALRYDQAPAPNERLPFRWMSPEAFDGEWGEGSEVWALGVVVWEALALGAQPYAQRDRDDVAEGLRQGRLLEEPRPYGDNRLWCHLVSLMHSCWSPTPSARPSFEALAQSLSAPSPAHSAQPHYSHLTWDSHGGDLSPGRTDSLTSSGSEMELSYGNSEKGLLKERSEAGVV